MQEVLVKRNRKENLNRTDVIVDNIAERVLPAIGWTVDFFAGFYDAWRARRHVRGLKAAA